MVTSRSDFAALEATTGAAPMGRWRKRLFAFMAWNASSATDFFRIPSERLLDLGARIEF